MHPSIVVVQDHERVCGWRKEGGLYLRSDDPGVSCAVLPLPLKDCDYCLSHGLKCSLRFSRGWTKINPSTLWDWDNITCPNNPDNGLCHNCTMRVLSQMKQAWVVWVGERPYSTPQMFDDEANRLGISRRVPHGNIPHGFTIGEDWVFLAHLKTIPDGNCGFDKGVFRVFRPSRVEVICSGDEDDETIEKYLKRGLTPVKVERVE